MKVWHLYTDGACSPNPGLGGWAFILRPRNRRLNDEEIVQSGWAEKTTNNRMELLAFIKGHERFSQENANGMLHLFSDSRYLIDGIRKWCEGWQFSDWKKSDGSNVLNKDLWEKIFEIKQHTEIKCTHVRGHMGHKENEEADRLAVLATKEGKRKLKSTGCHE